MRIPPWMKWRILIHDIAVYGFFGEILKIILNFPASSFLNSSDPIINMELENYRTGWKPYAIELAEIYSKLDKEKINMLQLFKNPLPSYKENCEVKDNIPEITYLIPIFYKKAMKMIIQCRIENCAYNKLDFIKQFNNEKSIYYRNLSKIKEWGRNAALILSNLKELGEILDEIEISIQKEEFEQSNYSHISLFDHHNDGYISKKFYSLSLKILEIGDNDKLEIIYYFIKYLLHLLKEMERILSFFRKIVK